MNLHKNSGRRSLLLSTALNFFITVVQIVGGILSNSLSLLSDAVHNLGDTIAVFLAFLANKFGNKPANNKKTFGYKRLEVIAAFINAAVLIIISLLLIIEAIKRFYEPEPVKGGLMLIVASAGLIANLISVLLLNPHKKSNINIKAAYLHLLGDTLSSFAVIFGGIAIIIWDAYWIDPLITALIGLYLIYHTIEIFKTSFNVLMQSTPEGLDVDKLKQTITSLPEICNIHHIHTWTLDEQKIFLECHIKLCDDIKVSDTEVITKKLEKLLFERYNISHITIQYEYRNCTENSV